MRKSAAATCPKFRDDYAAPLVAVSKDFVPFYPSIPLPLVERVHPSSVPARLAEDLGPGLLT
jgi:hypothetical protein